MRKMILLYALMSTALYAEEPMIVVPFLNEGLEIAPKIELEPEIIVDIPLPEPLQLFIGHIEPPNCAGDFHKAISALESDRAKLWELMNAAKKPDMSLSTRKFVAPVIKGEKMLSSLRMRNGVDATLFTTHPTGDILYRSLAEFKGYTTQKPFAGICAGATTLTKFYAERNVALFKRADDYKQSAKIFADEAKLETSETPRRTGLIAAHYFVQDAGFRYVSLSDGVKKLLSDVDTAHGLHCKC